MARVLHPGLCSLPTIYWLSNTTPAKIQPAHPNLQQRNNNQTNMETIDKLRQFDLSDEQIAEVLELPLALLKQVEWEDWVWSYFSQ